MIDKMQKELIKSYHSTIIPLCRLLKAHSTNAFLLPKGLIALYPPVGMSGVRNYMVLNKEYLYDYSKFVYTFFSIPSISKINTKFKKTKSTIDWETSKEGQSFLVVANDEENLWKSPILANDDTVKEVLESLYGDSPLFDIHNTEDFDEFEEIPNCEEFISDMLDKKLCQITVRNNPILLARPFLGDLKKTKEVRYKVVKETDETITLKFAQVEEMGTIYTYASFLKLGEE